MTTDYEQIDRYINGELTGEALTNFEAKLLIDKALAEEVSLYKDVGNTLTTAYAYKEEDAALEQTFNQLGKKYFTKEATIQETDSAKIKQDNTKVVQLQPTTKENKKGNWSDFRWLRPAIGFAVAALIALLIFQPWQRSLIDHYYEPFALNITQRSGDMATLTQAQKAYNSGDYASALPVFEKYPNNVEVQIAKGNSEYNLGKTNEAIATFQPIASGNSIHVPAANWYLALAYLKQEQKEKAKTALDEIPEGSSYYAKAQELRAKI